MKKYAFVDIESRSACDLAEHGINRYLADSTTAPVSIVAVVDDAAKVWVNAAWTPGVTCMPKGSHDSTLAVSITYSAAVPKWLRDLAKSHTFVGHNATDFDAPFCEKIGVKAKWLDTLPIARQAGLPGALDAIGKMLFGKGKHDGKAVLPKFFDAKHKYPYYLLWALVNYNIADCEITRDLFNHLTPYFADAETELLAVHNTINRRGIAVDDTLRAAIANVSIEAQNRAFEEIEAITNGKLRSTDLRSVPKMKAWLSSMGFYVENTRRETFNQLLADPDAFFTEGPGLDLGSVMPIVPKVLRLRSAATRTTGSKVSRIEARTDPDGRLRGMFVYHGAHTGRFTSRAVQLHNLNRGIDKCDVVALLSKPLTYQRVAAEAARLRALGVGWIGADDILATLIRYVFIPTPGRYLSVIDYSAIEARGAAWIAGEEKLLDAYRHERDVYCEFGSMLFGRTITKADKIERQISKVVVLGSQYGLGHKKLGYYVAAQGVDLATANVTALQCTEAYRNAYPAIAGYKSGDFRRGGIWHKLNDAVKSVVADGATLSVGKCVIGMFGPHLIIQLPSQRELTYRNARIEKVVPSWGGEPMPSVTYDSQFGYRKNLYGGLLCLAADTRVYTGRGIQRIVDVLPGDRVFDGVEWVETSGCVYQGVSQTWQRFGVSATADHLTHDGAKWLPWICGGVESALRLLSSARDSVHAWLCVNANLENTLVYRVLATVERLAWSKSQRCAKGAPCGAARAAGLAASRDTKTLSPIPQCVLCGVTDTPGSFPAATTPSAKRTGTTGLAVSRCAMSGAMTCERSYNTPQLYRAGMNSGLISTESITTETTNPVICGACRERLAPTIGAAQNVYDLADCGPRQSFMLATDCGPILSHNCENVVQAICRDLLCDALVRMERVADVVLHVHDEIVCEVDTPGEHDTLMRLMREVPTWASGFPISVEGHCSRRYGKQRFD